MQSSTNLPLYSQIFRKIARPFFRFLFRLITKVDIVGEANIPSDTGYLVASNHISIYEPPLLASFWPEELEIAAAVEVLQRPIQSEIMRLYGTIHVQRGRIDRALIGAILERLAAGFPVLIFPEGMRTHKPGLIKGNTGAAYLAAKADVPLVPVGVTGTHQLLQALKGQHRPEIKIKIGSPLIFPPLEMRSVNRKAALMLRTDAIMRAIAALLPIDYQGLYA